MGKPVWLRSIVDALDMQMPESMTYLNRETGEIVMVMGEEMRAAEEGAPPDDSSPDWQQESYRMAVEILRTASGGAGSLYVPLPAEYDIHEYSIMEDFCYSVEDDHVSRMLSIMIQGRGAFRRFKDAIHEYGIAQEWYDYRDNALKRIAMDWCEAHAITFVDTEEEPEEPAPDA